MGLIDVRTNPLPATRPSGLLVEQIADEVVVYDLETKNVHCLSPLAAAVFESCDGRTTPAQAATAASERLDRDVSTDEVLAAAEQLEERSLFHSPMLTLHGSGNGNGDGLSRRDFARRGALAGAVAFAAPLITSIAAPTAAMATSGIASGCGGCGRNHDCISNHCCQSVPGKQCNQGCCVDHDNSCHFCNCVNGTCECTVDAAGLNTGVCPCICGTRGCTNTLCCQPGTLCCTETPAC